MRTRARWGGSTVQAVLVVFSFGLLATSVLFDLVGLVSRQTVWAAAARWDLEVGLAGGAVVSVLALAAVTGGAAESRARRLRLLRAAAQVGSVVAFGGALALRRGAAFPGAFAVVLSSAGLGLCAVAVWLAAELAGRLDGADG